MVMNWSHAEDALSPQLERPHLQNYGERFNHKNPANKEEQNLLLDNHRYGTERSPQRQRTHIAHKNFRRVRVVPEETKRSADQCTAKHREFSNAGDVLNFEIRSPS